MACHPGCGACCIAPSISSPLPGMPQGKAAGTACLHLTPEHRCAIYHHPARPAVCAGFPMLPEHCGSDHADAMALLAALERLTA